MAPFGYIPAFHHTAVFAMLHIRPTVAKKFAALGLLLLFSPLRGAPQGATAFPGPANQLPMGVIGIVFDFLSGRDVVATQQICTAWRTLFQGYDEDRQWELVHPNFRFGVAKWRYFYGVIVTDAPSIPREWLFRLLRNCPIWSDQKMRDTHLLTLIPAGLTLDWLEELIQRPKGGGQATAYKNYDSAVQQELGNQPCPAPYWVLMTRHILPDSRDKDVDQHQALIDQQAQRSSVSYRMPHALEAAASLLAYFVHTDMRLYGDETQDVRTWELNKPAERWTFTRCQEKVIYGTSSVFVGGFASAGLDVCNDEGFYDSSLGVSCVLDV